MPDNRIRELRKSAGLTLEQLEEKTGISAGHLSKMETGKRGLSKEIAEIIAMALGSRAAAVMGLDDGAAAARQLRGLSDDAVPYVERGADDPFTRLVGRSPNRELKVVRGNMLDRIGLCDGDVVVLDRSQAAVDRLKPLEVVEVVYHYDPEKPGKAVRLLRQFVPPSLLITNSSVRNAPSLDMQSDDAQIVAVVVSSHRALHG